jgi:hypothetical protein
MVRKLPKSKIRDLTPEEKMRRMREQQLSKELATKYIYPGLALALGLLVLMLLAYSKAN